MLTVLAYCYGDNQKTIKHHNLVIIMEDTTALLNPLLPLILNGNLEKALATLCTRGKV